MKRFFEKFFKCQRENDIQNELGSTMVEYVFLVALISLGCITVITIMREAIEDKFIEAETAIKLGQGNNGP